MSGLQYQHMSCQVDGGVLLVTISEANLTGDALAEALRRELLTALAHSGAAKIVLDLGKVTYMSSAAFRPLLSLKRKIQELGGRLVLCGLKGEVEHIFRVTRLVTTSPNMLAPFEMQPDVAAARAKMSEVPAEK
jgi:stage II sporulation protein AA (anti-sigma F factor antagonist)